MKRPTKYLSWMDIIVYGGVILAVFIGLFCTGCVKRECSYNPTTGEFHYKSNFFATDTSADWVRITLPDGTVIEFRKFIQDNDSVKMITPYGAVKTKAN